MQHCQFISLNVGSQMCVVSTAGRGHKITSEGHDEAKKTSSVSIRNHAKMKTGLVAYARIKDRHEDRKTQHIFEDVYTLFCILPAHQTVRCCIGARWHRDVTARIGVKAYVASHAPVFAQIFCFWSPASVVENRRVCWRLGHTASEVGWRRSALLKT